MGDQVIKWSIYGETRECRTGKGSGRPINMWNDVMIALWCHHDVTSCWSTIWWWNIIREKVYHFDLATKTIIRFQHFIQELLRFEKRSTFFRHPVNEDFRPSAAMRGSSNIRQGSRSFWQKQSSDNIVFCCFLVLSFFYRSQMVDFKEIYHF